jgi:Flp pilus assembly protein TadD
MLGLLLLAAAASPAALADRLAEAEHAISAGRLNQARAMVAAAVANGGERDLVNRAVADLAYAEANCGNALAGYKVLLQRQPDDAKLLERAATCAVKLDRWKEGKALADRAVASPSASWRAWNVRGVIADRDGDFAAADAAYKRALAQSPNRGEVLNNIGWSRLLRGDWKSAVEPLEQAASLMPKSARAVNNLELARAGLASDLPTRRLGESDDAWAARLNDAGVAARLRGERARAVAAFARAVEARGSWYQRAANNLSWASGEE